MVSFISAGGTVPGKTDWKKYGKDGIYVDVDTSGANFPDTPHYVASLGCTTIGWATIGGSVIYEARPTGFRVYVRFADGRDITPENANAWNFHINWVGVI